MSRWLAFQTWYYNVGFCSSFQSFKSKVVARWRNQACLRMLLYWHQHVTRVLTRQVDHQRLSKALELVDRQNSPTVRCVHHWMLYAQLCRRSRVYARRTHRHKAQLLQLRSLSKWSIVSISKQVDVWETLMTRSELSVSSAHIGQQVGSPLRSDGFSRLCGDQEARDEEDCDVDHLQRALLSSYRRLEAERLRRRVVLSWATAITRPRT